jgi:ankyrin repeat protein
MDNGQDSYGNTALRTACEEEGQEVAKLLISHGASREIQNREKKKSFEMSSPQFAIAVFNKHIPI